MKVKVGEIVASKDGLLALQKAPLNAVTAWKIAGIVKAINEHYTIYEETRVAKIKEMGAESKDGTWSVLPENEDVFKDEMAKLMDGEVDINIKKISIEDLKKSDGLAIDISPGELFGLEWFIT